MMVGFLVVVVGGGGGADAGAAVSCVDVLLSDRLD